MFKFPKISCLTVTTGRDDLLKKSIRCYLNQTYPQKELIVVSQGDPETNGRIKNHILSLNREDIVLVEAPQDLSLGAMRNLSVELATASIVCQWDDDDLYHPHRMMAQYHALLSKETVASLYNQHLKYFVESKEIYWCDWSFERPLWRTLLCGSIMFYKEIFHKLDNHLYPETGRQSDREEDMHVLQRLSKIGNLSSVNYGHHYVYVFHGNNVYDRKHHELALQKRLFDFRELEAKKDLLFKTFDILEIEKGVQVKSQDGVVFEYSE